MDLDLNLDFWGDMEMEYFYIYLVFGFANELGLELGLALRLDNVPNIFEAGFDSTWAFHIKPHGYFALELKFLMERDFELGF